MTAYHTGIQQEETTRDIPNSEALRLDDLYCHRQHISLKPRVLPAFAIVFHFSVISLCKTVNDESIFHKETFRAFKLSSLMNRNGKETALESPFLGSLHLFLPGIAQCITCISYLSPASY